MNVVFVDKKRRWPRILLWIIYAILIILATILVATTIAYVADFIIYKGTDQDGLLWTVAQRQKGLFR
ncbi:hypothetical protein HGG69_01345 [Mycoplasma phocoenae]|uniref:Uncharacterized protein n=2 Tax=Mycoplasma phocoenae TaxID=754517 RepID=A0A858U296_9MOLU|nr:hypothetical protein HGG69_01345 [Mycoplasma phocoenae]